MPDDTECGERTRPARFGFSRGLFAMGMGRGWGGDVAGARVGRRLGGGRGGRSGAAGLRRRRAQARLSEEAVPSSAPPRLRPHSRVEESPRQLRAEPGGIYPTLPMLQDMGPDRRGEDGGARKAFRHKEGERISPEKAEEVEGLFERLDGLGSDHRKAAARRSPLGRQFALRPLASSHREDMDENRLTKSRDPRRGGAEDRR